MMGQGISISLGFKGVFSSTRDRLRVSEEAGLKTAYAVPSILRGCDPG